MGSWTPDPDHRGWQRFAPAGPDDWPDDAPERCPCWPQGCLLTRHRVGDASTDPEAPDDRPWRYEIFHARPVTVPKPARAEPRDHRRLAAGDR